MAFTLPMIFAVWSGCRWSPNFCVNLSGCHRICCVRRYFWNNALFLSGRSQNNTLSTESKFGLGQGIEAKVKVRPDKWLSRWTNLLSYRCFLNLKQSSLLWLGAGLKFFFISSCDCLSFSSPRCSLKSLLLALPDSSLIFRFLSRKNVCRSLRCFAAYSCLILSDQTSYDCWVFSWRKSVIRYKKSQ